MQTFGVFPVPTIRLRLRWRRLAVLALTVSTGLAAVAVSAPSASAATVDPNASYVLINRASGKALDLYDRATSDGARITQWTRNDQAQQQWQFVDSGGGYYRLRSRHSGKVLDVTGASTANGAAVVQWSDTNAAHQQFRLADSADGSVRLIARHSNKAVEVQNAATTDGAAVVQYDDWNGANQQWQLVPVTGSPPGGTGTYINPVIWQDFADGDIIRVGDAYYYSASTMHYSPGAPILRSYDLVNWEYAGHSVPSLDFDSAAYDLSGGRAYVKGIWPRRSTTARATAPTTGSGARSSTGPTCTPPPRWTAPGRNGPGSTSATTTPGC